MSYGVLKFQHAVFDTDHINTTARDMSNDPVADVFGIVDNDDNLVGYGHRIGEWIFDISKNPTTIAVFLRHEHEPRCRTLPGLIQVLDEIYGRGEWGPQINIIGFIFKPKPSGGASGSAPLSTGSPPPPGVNPAPPDSPAPSDLTNEGE